MRDSRKRVAFAARLDPARSGDASLLYFTYLEGRSSDLGASILADGAGMATVLVQTSSSDFPTTSGAFDPSQNGGNDLWLGQLDTSVSGGASLVSGTYVGGSRDDRFGTVQRSGASLFVSGDTRSGTNDFPTSPGAYDESYNGQYDTFLVRLRSASAVCGDGVCDPGEDPCSCPADCVPAATETDCTDGCDNDGDTLVDCLDPDCQVDNDGDTYLAAPCGADCNDGDPAVNPGMTEVCDDGIDNDCAGGADCSDPACDGDPACPSCSPNGTPCSDDSECCSNNCGNNGKCKGGGGGDGSVAVETFPRGDSNGDLAVDVSDSVYTLIYLFLGGPAPLCSDAADANEDGALDVSDPLFTLNTLFGGASPKSDWLECASDAG